jgi:hypothetical protein
MHQQRRGSRRVWCVQSSLAGCVRSAPQRLTHATAPAARSETSCADVDSGSLWNALHRLAQFSNPWHLHPLLAGRSPRRPVMSPTSSLEVGSKTTSRKPVLSKYSNEPRGKGRRMHIRSRPGWPILAPHNIYDARPWWALSAYDSENYDAGVDCHYPITIGNDRCVRRAERLRGGLG